MTHDGNLRYKLRKRYYDGRTALLMAPMAFVKKLAALIPPPYLNLVRFHGIFAAHAKRRPLLRALLPSDDATSSAGHHADTAAKGPAVIDERDPVPIHIRSQWAELLRATLGIDVFTCPDCGGKMRLLALIKDKPVIDQILTHLGLATDFPPASPARAPPQFDFDDID